MCLTAFTAVLHLKAKTPAAVAVKLAVNMPAVIDRELKPSVPEKMLNEA